MPRHEMSSYRKRVYRSWATNHRDWNPCVRPRRSQISRSPSPTGRATYFRRWLWCSRSYEWRSLRNGQAWWSRNHWYWDKVTESTSMIKGKTIYFPCRYQLAARYWALSVFSHSSQHASKQLLLFILHDLNRNHSAHPFISKFLFFLQIQSKARIYCFQSQLDTIYDLQLQERLTPLNLSDQM